MNNNLQGQSSEAKPFIARDFPTRSYPAATAEQLASYLADILLLYQEQGIELHKRSRFELALNLTHDVLQRFDVVAAHKPRESALQNGQLIDVSHVARKLGIPLPVAATKGAYERCQAVTRNGPDAADADTVIREVLSAFLTRLCGEQTPRRSSPNPPKGSFAGGRFTVAANAGDDGKPVLTIKLDDER